MVVLSPDPTGHQHVKNEGSLFEVPNVHIMDRKDQCFHRGTMEAIYVKMERQK